MTKMVASNPGRLKAKEGYGDPSPRWPAKLSDSSPKLKVGGEHDVLEFRIGRLLTCPEDEIAEAAARLIEGIESRNKQNWPAYLEVLAKRVTEAGFPIQSKLLRNYLAAIEILCYFRSPESANLIEIGLKAPIGWQHLYLVSMIGGAVNSQSDQASRIADTIGNLLNAATAENTPGIEITQFSSECFHAMRAIAPMRLAGPICRYLPCVGSLELTSVLHDIVEVARSLGNAFNPGRELVAVIGDLLERYMNSPEDDVDNMPGVMSRLLELNARASRRFSEEIKTKIENHPLKAQILYLLVQDQLVYLNRDDRAIWYAMCIRALVADDSGEEAGEVFGLVSKDKLLGRVVRLEGVMHFQAVMGLTTAA